MAQWVKMAQKGKDGTPSEYAPGHKHMGYRSNLFEVLFFHLQYFVFSLKTSLKTSG